MLERLPVRRHARRFALLALVATVLSALPGLPAVAQGSTTQPLDDTQVDFARGTVQRTSVSSGVVGGDPKPFPDQDGTLELAPVGVLQQWQTSTSDLPVPLAAMGVTTIGNRLYTVAGATGAAANEAFTDAVYWTTIEQQTGSFAQTTAPAGAQQVNPVWVNDKLPQAAAYMTPAPNPSGNCDAELITGRRAPAVASFVTGTGTNFIYVVGGAFNLSSNCGQGSLTSPAVQIGSVNATSGDITWTGANDLQTKYLPTQNLPGLENWTTPTYVGLGAESFGVEGATASVVTTGSGQTYLYVIGGLVTYDAGNGKEALVTPAVYYTKLNATTGALESPLNSPPPSGTPWARGPNVPLNTVQSDPLSAPPPGELGIYNHTAIVSRAVVGSGTGTVVRSAIYVTGGFTEIPGGTLTANPVVYRATVADDGSLTWSTTLDPARPNQRINTDGEPRGYTAGFAYSNKLYILGGVGDSDPATAPLGSISIGVHDDRLSMLPLFGDSSSPVYFTGATGSSIDPVYSLGAAVVPAAPLDNQTTVENAAWGYAIGGFAANDQPTAAIFRGKIGGSAETSETRRIPDGWYYSRFHNIRFETENTEAKILSVRWFSGIDRSANSSADLRLEFQRTKLLPCNEAAFATSTWVALDGDSGTGFSSKDGFNEVKLRDIFPTEDFSASCFRYRVYMTQNGNAQDGTPNPAANGNVSPRLFSINVEKIKPGDPDLKLEAFEIGPDADGRISTFNLQIKNLNDNLLNTVAVPASSNQFPIVLCVAYSATDPNVALTLPTLPITNDPNNRVDCAPLYRFIDPSETTPGQVFSLNDQWDVNYDNVVHIPNRGQDDRLPNVLEAFATPGHYAVAALIDPYNSVLEGGEAKTNNRGENLNSGQPLIRRFTITEAGFVSKVYLPVVSR